MSLDPMRKPISFKRHIVAVLGANFVIATLFALAVGVLAVWNTGSAAMLVMISIITWLGAFVIAAPTSGFLFTLFWPFLRKANSLGWLISCLLGALGGYATIWANYSAVGKHSNPAEPFYAAIFGGAVGAAYWLIAVKRDRTAEPNPGQGEAEELAESPFAS